MRKKQEKLMAGTMSILVREMTPEDYDKVYELWNSIQGFGIRSIDDSREGVERFLKRNPTTSVVAVQNGRIIGAILCGHDGRTGFFYHVCVASDYRNHGVGHRMAHFAMQALRAEGVNKVSLVAFKSNALGNEFWHNVGWQRRDDMNYYDFVLNEENITNFIR
ncbi:GNAT family N-acetyltransferase [Brotaphodocola catenula]|uniref:GNAT family N-acetyltransferase n=1 Tax=Brotaphodocola catenula TaxID=2885361 RepID=A0AAE3AS43_9FIRM|nr:GNAT family N-acetyltransferase [Brotaphodocola catenula]MCC2165700.1 GNAT family N-acetyltransferase [Brotaphodocola catenula]